MKRRRRLKIFVITSCGLIAVWVLGDFIYASIVAYRARAWEANVERDEHGVQRGHQAYSLGEGTTGILFVHGINDSPVSWRKMAPVLADKGFACRIMRMPGFAEPLERYGGHTKEDWIAAVESEVANLKRGHDRVCIVAHSLGAAITIGYLLENPADVDAVVLLAPLLKVSNIRSPLLPTRFWHEFANWTLYFTRVTATPFDVDAHDPTEQDFKDRSTFTPRRVVDELFHLVDNNRGRGGEIRVPLLAVISRDDVVVNWEAAEAFYQQVASPTKKRLFTKDSGHQVPVDYDWEELTGEIEQFFRDTIAEAEPSA